MDEGSEKQKLNTVTIKIVIVLCLIDLCEE